MSRWITVSEIRLALRLIAKQPVLSLTIVLALATGVCLATVNMPDVGVMTPLIVIGTLAVSSVAATWLPTRRALGIRPSEALNSD